MHARKGSSGRSRLCVCGAGTLSAVGRLTPTNTRDSDQSKPQELHERYIKDSAACRLIGRERRPRSIEEEKLRSPLPAASSPPV